MLKNNIVDYYEQQYNNALLDKLFSSYKYEETWAWVRDCGRIDTILASGAIIEIPEHRELFVGEKIEIWNCKQTLMLSRFFMFIQETDPEYFNSRDFSHFKQFTGMIISLSARSAEVRFDGDSSEIEAEMYWHSTGEVHDSYVENNIIL